MSKNFWDTPYAKIIWLLHWTGNNFDGALAGLWFYSGLILHRASPCAFDVAPSELPKLFKALQKIHLLNIIENFRCRGVPPSINFNTFLKGIIVTLPPIYPSSKRDAHYEKDGACHSNYLQKLNAELARHPLFRNIFMNLYLFIFLRRQVPDKISQHTTNS